MLMELNSWLNLSVRENVGPCFYFLFFCVLVCVQSFCMFVCLNMVGEVGWIYME